MHNYYYFNITLKNYIIKDITSKKDFKIEKYLII